MTDAIMTLDIEAIKARADKAARKWASSDFYQDSAEDIPDLLAALEASETALVKAEQERDALKEALKPFADEAFRYEPDDGDSDLPIWDCQLTLGQLRAARRALEAKP